MEKTITAGQENRADRPQKLQQKLNRPSYVDNNANKDDVMSDKTPGGLGFGGSKDGEGKDETEGVLERKKDERYEKKVEASVASSIESGSE